MIEITKLIKSGDADISKFILSALRTMLNCSYISVSDFKGNLKHCGSGLLTKARTFLFKVIDGVETFSWTEWTQQLEGESEQLLAEKILIAWVIFSVIVRINESIIDRTDLKAFLQVLIPRLLGYGRFQRFFLMLCDMIECKKLREHLRDIVKSCIENLESPLQKIKLIRKSQEEIKKAIKLLFIAKELRVIAKSKYGESVISKNKYAT